MKKKLTLQPTIVYFLIVVNFLMVFLSACGFARLLPVNILYFFLPSNLCLLFLSFFSKQVFLPAKFYFLNKLFFMFTFIISLASILTSFLIFPNYFYATFHLDPYHLYLLPLFFYLLLFFYRTKTNQNWKFLTFFAPLLLILLAALTRIRGYGVYARYFANEDTWIEYFQFIFYLLAAAFSLRASFFLKKRSSFLFCLYLLIAIGFFLIAGEEISWGQRIFNIETPESIRVNNTQGELNLHNNNKIFGYVYRAYILLAGYSAFTWILKVLILDKIFPASKKFTQLFVPHWQYSSAFMASFIIFYLHRIKNLVNLQIFEEFNEFIFSLALMSFFFENFWRLKLEAKSEKK